MCFQGVQQVTCVQIFFTAASLPLTYRHMVEQTTVGSGEGRGQAPLGLSDQFTVRLGGCLKCEHGVNIEHVHVYVGQLQFK